MNNIFKFEAKVWLYPGEKGAWHFVTLPLDLSEDLHRFYSDEKRGWGSLPIEATTGSSSWKTSVFPDSKSGSFMLPLKADIRKKENIHLDQTILFTIKILV